MHFHPCENLITEFFIHYVHVLVRLIDGKRKKRLGKGLAQYVGFHMFMNDVVLWMMCDAYSCCMAVLSF